MSTKVLGAHSFSVIPDVNGAPVLVSGEQITFTPQATPIAPAEGLTQYCRNVAGRRLPAFLGPSNFENYFQTSMFASRITQWLPGNGTTAAVAYGDTWTIRNSGTSAAQSHPTRTTTNLLTFIKRALYGTGTTTGGASGVQSTNVVAFRGNADGIGGFFFYARFAIETYQAAMRAFVGLSATSGALASDPSTRANSIGLGKDSTDSTWQIISRNASAVTKSNTGVVVNAGDVLDLIMFCKPNDTKVTVSLTKVNTGQHLVDDLEITATLPVNTVGLYAQAHNQSTSGTTAKSLSLAGIYIESDN